MGINTDRRKLLGLAASAVVWSLLPAEAQTKEDTANRGDAVKSRRPHGQPYALPNELSDFSKLSIMLGRITDRAVTISALSTEPIEAVFEYGIDAGPFEHKTAPFKLTPGQPLETVLDQLKPDTQYKYRMLVRHGNDQSFTARQECHFHTQRAKGSGFTFSIQGDSHPERPQMSDPVLYARTLLNAAAGKPDFHICMGDDFSVEPVRTVTADTVGERYTLQRPFLGLISQSAPIFLLNGNHEQASLFNFNQSDVRHDVAVLAQNARNTFYPTPAPSDFYSGDATPLKSIGLLKDYYAWTWGDALFVVLDNYWQSPAQVDSGFHDEDAAGGKDRGGRKNRDGWTLTLGDAQYNWLKQTLEQSNAKFKFVFAHHVLGTGRGGVDQCDLFEWGGRNKRGDWEFEQKRPGWPLPIHQLMVKHGVTIFFQGHDHLFAKQEKDGVIYQEVPMPADQGYATYNDDRYQSGTKLPNSGHLKVLVTADQVTVDYVRCFLPADETAKQKTGDVAHSYTLKARRANA